MCLYQGFVYTVCLRRLPKFRELEKNYRFSTWMLFYNVRCPFIKWHLVWVFFSRSLFILSKVLIALNSFLNIKLGYLAWYSCSLLVKKTIRHYILDSIHSWLKPDDTTTSNTSLWIVACFWILFQDCSPNVLYK